jgi:hypothetical protein
VETYGTYPQYGAEVAPLSGNDFVVVWSGFDGYGFCGSEYGFCGNEGVRAQRFRVATAPPSGCASAPAASCRVSTVPEKSKLLVVDAADDAYDLVRWIWSRGEATAAGDFGDPTTSTSFALCLYDDAGTLLYGSLIEAGGTCGTKPCWKALGTPPGSAGFKYKSKTREPHGIAKLTLKPGDAGKAKIVAKGGHELLYAGSAGAPELPLSLPATMLGGGVRRLGPSHQSGGRVQGKRRLIHGARRASTTWTRSPSASRNDWTRKPTPSSSRAAG